MTGWFSEGVFEHLNDKINNCDNMPDRICWELSNQQIFFTKDKECIVENIHKFVEQNKGYYKFDDGVSALEKDHVVERFLEIASDILSLDEIIYPMFILKNTSVDETVSELFYIQNDETGKYEDCLLDNHINKCPYHDFVAIADGTLEFILHDEFDFKEYRKVLRRMEQNGVEE